MNKVLKFVSFSLFYITFIFYLFFSIKESGSHTPFYYYPNGFVVPVNNIYSNYWGKKIDLLEMEIITEISKNSNLINFIVHLKDSKNTSQSSKSISFSFLKINKFQIALQFIGDCIIALIYLIIAIWFFFYLSDLHVFFLLFSLSNLFIFNFFLVGFHSYHFLFFFFLTLVNFNILNLFRRFQGKEIPINWVIPQLVLSIIIGLIAKENSDNGEIFELLLKIEIYFTVAIIILNISYILFDLFRNQASFFIISKKFSLVFSLIGFFIVPWLIIQFFHEDTLKYLRIIILISQLIFPFLFFYGIYKYSLVSFQNIFTHRIINLYLILLISIAYFLIDFIFSNLYKKIINYDSFYFNLLFLTILITLIVPIRRWIVIFIDYWSFQRNNKLTNSVETINNLLNKPISMKAMIRTLSIKVKETLNIDNIKIMIPNDLFHSKKLNTKEIIRINKGSDIWDFLSKKKEIIATSNLYYAFGIKEKVYNYLVGLGVHLVYPILIYDANSKKKLIGCIFVGEKLNKKSFSIGEMRFIREISRLASLLFDNYSLLLDEIQRKRIIRNLNLASIVDRTLQPSIDKIDGVDIDFLFIPALGISGDYLEVIKLTDNKVFVAIGDVSGHGLGTGYLVSAIREIIKILIKEKKSVTEIITSINRFLIERYKGNEFMSLICGIIDLKNKKFNYINAGHLAPIFISKDGNLIKNKTSQRVLGILKTNYIEIEENLNDSVKIILYTDGIVETFNNNEEAYGENRLTEIIKINFDLKSDELVKTISKNLELFRNDNELSDDLSLICIQF